ncbi:hypothetical protein BD311DRAFT_528277 [Dichomitus squalens]|uniref:Uncharacterized protein n=1 Tax=Dichomitus squalens TaxID=114155 RepID=A0A4Q9MCL8_9APHY|nr:hypothetical protein BD311DRAFT_528277 [Dichomitus squalens]
MQACTIPLFRFPSIIRPLSAICPFVPSDLRHSRSCGHTAVVAAPGPSPNACASLHLPPLHAPMHPISSPCHAIISLHSVPRPYPRHPHHRHPSINCIVLVPAAR